MIYFICQARGLPVKCPVWQVWEDKMLPPLGTLHFFYERVDPVFWFQTEMS